jgi:hypothetical protein
MDIEVADGVVKDNDTVYYSSTILMEGPVWWTKNTDLPRHLIRIMFENSDLGVNGRYSLSQETVKNNIFIDKRKAEMYHKLKGGY